MGLDTLTTVYIGNLLGLALLITILFSNINITADTYDGKNLFHMIIVTGLACIADSVVFTVDGHPGPLTTGIIYLGNSWLFMANILMGRYWVEFVAEHMNVMLSRTQRRFLKVLSILGVLGLLLNLYIPIVFTVENNVYRRTQLYWIYVLFAALCICDTGLIYYQARKKSGLLKFFPIQVFIVPVILGIVAQSLVYGISVIWASVAIALAGVMTALKNEIIFRDRLTGLYNRAYLDYLENDLYRNKKVKITGVMIDLNDFKSINDRFGHNAGDHALQEAAEIFSKTVGDLGSVIRYAGDEFVIMLNTTDPRLVQKVLGDIEGSFERLNKVTVQPYHLSASMGYAPLDMSKQTMNDFMNTIDRKMYENKALHRKAKENSIKNK